LLSGYAYAVKYTAALTLPFAVTWVWWRGALKWANLSRLAIPAFALIAPWIVRNWIWVGNPFAPFLNAWFPNPYYYVGMERLYVDLLKHYTGLKHWWQIPLELTLRGGLIGGSIGSGLSDSEKNHALEAEYRALEYGQGGQGRLTLPRRARQPPAHWCRRLRPARARVVASCETAPC